MTLEGQSWYPYSPVTSTDIREYAELLPKLEAVVTSKFRAGGPRSGSAPLRRPRTSPTGRVRNGSRSQEHVDSDSDSDHELSIDSGSPRPGQEDDTELLKGDLQEPAAASGPHDDMIDPALLALDGHDTMHQAMDALDAADLGLGDDAAAHSYLAEAVMESENADVEQEAHSHGQKRKHDEDSESSGRKRSKKEKGKGKVEDSTDATSLPDTSSHTSGSADLDMDSALHFGSPSAVTLASEAAKDPFLEAEPHTETAEEKKIRKEEKRKRKEEKRARKEAKRLSQAQMEPMDISASAMPETFEY
jgi:hypothetical protein